MTRNVLSFLLCVLALCSFSASIGGAVAKNRALLVGVSQYTGGARNRLSNLSGPRNDVTMMWRYLKDTSLFEGADIQVLAEGLPTGARFPQPTGKPEYATIVAGLIDLAKQNYVKGDIVIFYFSGHGTTQPVDVSKNSELEAADRDQVLLPSDTGMYYDDTRRIQNGLVDNEIGTLVAAIRKKGALVWVIVDSCQSGSATRGEDIARNVNPALLGVPEQKLLVDELNGRDRSGFLTPPMHDLVLAAPLIGFYAVDPFHLAIERHFEFTEEELPVAGVTVEQQRMGVFTRFLLTALSTGRARTYEELFQEIGVLIAADPRNASIARPVADGDLYLPLPNRVADALITKGMVSKGHMNINSGALRDFDVGAGVTIYDPNNADRAVAKARIVSATPIASTTGELAWLDGAELSYSGFLPVLVTEPVVSFGYQVNLPARAGAESVRVRRLLEQAFANRHDQQGVEITLASADEPNANLVLMVDGEEVWLLQPGQAGVIKNPTDFGKTLSIGLGAQDAEVGDLLTQAIWRLARAERLVRLAGRFAASIGAPDVEFKAARYRQGDLAADPRQPCKDRSLNPLTSDESKVAIPLNAKMSFGNCDILMLSLSNASLTTSYYAGAFYVDARGGVIPIPEANGVPSAGYCVYSLPAQSRRDLIFEPQIGTWDAQSNPPKPSTTGMEHIVILVVAQDSAPNLCVLAQDTISATLAAKGEKKGAQAPLDTLIAGIVGATRGVKALMKAGEAGTQLSMRSFVVDLQVQP